MSHVKTIKTTFGNFNYLKKTLEYLKINMLFSNKSIDNSLEIIIPQSNGHNLKFSWTTNSYNLYMDEDFWNQQKTPQDFINQIAQRYGEELVITETQKQNFCPISYTENKNGVKVMTVQQWIKI